MMLHRHFVALEAENEELKRAEQAETVQTEKEDAPVVAPKPKATGRRKANK